MELVEASLGMWFLVCKCGIKLCCLLSATYCMEFISIRWRAIVLFILEVSFCLMLTFSLFSSVVMTNIDKYNWNWLLGLSAVPIIISTIIVPVSQLM